ncbi:MAG TPA: YkvA family protein [Anaerolineales bacterium]
MTDRKPSNMVVPKGGMMRDLVKRLKLIGRLMADRRVSSFLKLLPLASVAYLIFPFDLAPGVVFPIVGALDDAAILWIGSTLFVELCPPNVVKEHMQELESNLDDSFSDEVVDVEATDLNDRK